MITKATKILFICILTGSLVALFAQQPEVDTEAKKGEAKIFPKGNAKKGALVFEVKLCHRCHTIPGKRFPEIDLPPIDNISLAGENNKGWTRDDYAHHIMDPQHIISPDHQKAMIIIGDKLGAENSPMPSFADLLTVQDLIHLATFLEEATSAHK